MAFDYADFALTADELLREFGVAVTLRTHSAGAYSPLLGTTSGDADVDTVVYAAMVPWDQIYIDGNKYEWDEEYRSGTGIKLEDIRCLMSPKSSAGAALPVPQQGDKVIINSVEYQIISLKPIQPALIPVLYDLVLRR